MLVVGPEPFASIDKVELVSRANGLKKNTLYLYALTGSNYVLGFISIPYLTRVLGPETYGLIGFGQAFYTYTQLILDFGFILSATALVSAARENPYKIGQILSSTILAKGILLLVVGGGVLILCLNVEIFKSDPLLFGLYVCYSAANVLLPDFVYRGIEQMGMITVRAVMVKCLALLGILLFVNDPGDYHLVPLLYAVSSFVAAIVVYSHLRRRCQIWFQRVSFKDVFHSLKGSAQFFLSRVATTVFQALNMLLIGGFYHGSPTVGWYSATNNCISAGRAVSSPIADSLYPYMLRTQNYRLFIKIVCVGFPVLSLIAFLAGIYAKQICVLLFGEGYEMAAPLLCLMLPLIPTAFLSYLFGFPALSPMGKAKIANYSIYVGSLIQAIGLVLLFVINNFGVYQLCILTLISEIAVVIVRLIAFVRGLRVKGGLQWND